MKLLVPSLAGLLATLSVSGPVQAAALAKTPPKAPQGSPQLRADSSADEQYNYISGLFEKGFHDLVVTESKKFLAANASHPRAPLVRYRLGQSLFELKKFADAKA